MFGNIAIVSILFTIFPTESAKLLGSVFVFRFSFSKLSILIYFYQHAYWSECFTYIWQFFYSKRIWKLLILMINIDIFVREYSLIQISGNQFYLV